LSEFDNFSTDSYLLAALVIYFSFRKDWAIRSLFEWLHWAAFEFKVSPRSSSSDCFAFFWIISYRPKREDKILSEGRRLS